LLLVLSITLSEYQHPPLQKECKPYLYPICYRANEPVPLAPASPVAVYLSVIATAALAIILVYAGYHATVLEQANLITPTANIGKTPAAPATTPPASPDVTPPTAKPATGVNPGMVN
jgi:hypothetical protein